MSTSFPTRATSILFRVLFERTRSLSSYFMSWIRCFILYQSLNLCPFPPCCLQQAFLSQFGPFWSFQGSKVGPIGRASFQSKGTQIQCHSSYTGGVISLLGFLLCLVRVSAGLERISIGAHVFFTFIDVLTLVESSIFPLPPLKRGKLLETHLMEGFISGLSCVMSCNSLILCKSFPIAPRLSSAL